MTSHATRPARILDGALDRLVLPGYTRIGPALRRKWWPTDPRVGSLAGKRVLVTGATSGIGEAMAGMFLDLGATLHILGRSEEKTTKLAAELRRDHRGAEVVEEICDIGDLDAVRTWAADFTSRVDALHGLVHNAGLMPPERKETAQGHEMALAVHVLGPSLMTDLLTDVLAAAGGASVVIMSSGGMYSAKLEPDNMESTEGDYKGIRAYARTKRMQVVLAKSWADLLEDKNIRVESTHPGWVATAGVTDSLPGFDKVIGPLLRTAQSGADTSVWLVATRPESGGEHFWHDRALRPTTVGWERGQDPADVDRFLAKVAEATGGPSAWR